MDFNVLTSLCLDIVLDLKLGFIVDGFDTEIQRVGLCFISVDMVIVSLIWIIALQHYSTSFYFFFQKRWLFKWHNIQLFTNTKAGLGGSVGCAVLLETRRSWVQPPPRSATFFRGD